MKKYLILSTFLLFIANTSFAVFTCTVADVLQHTNHPEMYNVELLHSEEGKACIEKTIADFNAGVAPNNCGSHLQFLIENGDKHVQYLKSVIGHICGHTGPWQE